MEEHKASIVPGNEWALHHRVANYVASNPIRALAALAVPSVGLIFYGQTGQQHLQMFLKLLHTRVFGQFTTLVCKVMYMLGCAVCQCHCVTHALLFCIACWSFLHVVLFCYTLVLMSIMGFKDYMDRHGNFITEVEATRRQQELADIRRQVLERLEVEHAQKVEKDAVLYQQVATSTTRKPAATPPAMVVQASAVSTDAATANAH